MATKRSDLLLFLRGAQQNIFQKALHQAKDESPGLSWEAVRAAVGEAVGKRGAVTDTALRKWLSGKDIPSRPEHADGFAAAFSEAPTPSFRSRAFWLEVMAKARHARALRAEFVEHEAQLAYFDRQTAVRDQRERLYREAFERSGLREEYRRIDETHPLPDPPHSVQEDEVARAARVERETAAGTPLTGKEHTLVQMVREWSASTGVDVLGLLLQLRGLSSAHPSQQIGQGHPIPPLLTLLSVLAECPPGVTGPATDAALGATRAVVHGIDRAAYRQRLIAEQARVVER